MKEAADIDVTMGKLRITNEIYLERARRIHGDRYQYKTEYKGKEIPVLISCNLHGDFWQKPQEHIYQQSGCPDCGLLKLSEIFSSNKDAFVEKALLVHKDRTVPYRYIGSYINNHTHMEIECPLHGSWMQKPANHLSGHGCQKCAKEYTANFFRLPLEEKIKKGILVHAGKYSYDLVDETKGQLEKVSITCPKHGVFGQTWSSHLLGSGCRKCTNSVSKPERLWLDEMGIPEENRQIKIMRGDRSKDNRRELYYRVDGIDHTTNTIYEYYGDYHHANPTKYKANEHHALFKCTYGEVYERLLKKEAFLKTKNTN
jgi:hypothetical protein